MNEHPDWPEARKRLEAIAQLRRERGWISEDDPSVPRFISTHEACVAQAALDRIDALEAENARMREALGPFAEAAEIQMVRGVRRERYTPADDEIVAANGLVRWGALRRARAALSSPSAQEPTA